MGRRLRDIVRCGSRPTYSEGNILSQLAIRATPIYRRERQHSVQRSHYTKPCAPPQLYDLGRPPAGIPPGEELIAHARLDTPSNHVYTPTGPLVYSCAAAH